MPWETISVFEERVRLVMTYLSGEATMTVLSVRHKVSRKTGYKWVKAYQSKGMAGLGDASRKPRSGRHWTRASTRELIVEMRKHHPRWGAAKIIARLRQLRPHRKWPAPSSAHGLLQRAGLVKRGPRRTRWPMVGSRCPSADRPNEIWTTDFKGQFRTGDRKYCYPLTVVDVHSRFLLACVALLSVSFEVAWPAFQKLFRMYGLPDALHHDNGEPFSSTVSVGGLSRLMVKFIRLGIRVERSRPGHPEDNGKHERMHRTLKDETTHPPGANRAAQQAKNDLFQQEFNYERPHEALGQRQPGRVYRSSRQPFPAVLPEIQYPTSFTIRRVRSGGDIMWNGRRLFITEVLVGERVGIVSDDNVSLMYFGPVLLGYIDDSRWKLLPTKAMKQLDLMEKRKTK